MAADRAEFPFLEPVNVRKGSAPRTPEDVVHNYEVMRASLIKIYRYPDTGRETGSLGHLCRCRNPEGKFFCPLPCQDAQHQTKSLYRAFNS
jgi:hypothetical protein